jgi:hypothetical protein
MSEQGTRTLLAQICHAVLPIVGEWEEIARAATTKTLLICATTAMFLNDSLRDAFVIPYSTQFSHRVGRMGCVCVQVAPS